MPHARAALLTVLLLSGCATAPTSAALRARRAEAAAPAVKALQDARFEDAVREASTVLQQDDGNATAHAVWAVAEYRRTLHDFVTDALSLASGSLIGRGTLSNRLVDATLTDTDDRGPPEQCASLV